MKKFLIIFLTVFINAQLLKPIPENVAYSKQKALLGKKLFFDTRLSIDNKISCASCHNVYKGGDDNRQFSVGVNGCVDKPMNSPTVFNSVFNISFFWNGRAPSLKIQAEEANQDSCEMGMKPDILEKRLNEIDEYKNLFKKIYGVDYIKYDLVFDAIAEFEKTLITPNSKFDLYLKGKAKLSKKEKEGFLLFKRYGCITCHNGINFGGNSYQKIGAVIEAYKMPRGRDRYEITKNCDDKYVYKVPTLRNIALTYPYFHDGSVKTLDKAVKLMGYYNLGLYLSDDDIDKIVAFLKTLTGKKPKILDER
ncbi:cytochrome c peroxidase [Lebetimonas natsushimae]|uniref:Cytochrome c peroxidase n=1 Tax=Lebetimonas natsushimae TaxID=1936991 RepID=A0A292YBR0_9BACT|nr:cytochrome-c peroxidase [Lebetimonas natsushimae]GAX86969.1 cytochrome c peroxidase [Lebetimonas natsushimae]